jgi:hypothetical protein
VSDVVHHMPRRTVTINGYVVDVGSANPQSWEVAICNKEYPPGRTEADYYPGDKGWADFNEFYDAESALRWILAHPLLQDKAHP